MITLLAVFRNIWIIYSQHFIANLCNHRGTLIECTPSATGSWLHCRLIKVCAITSTLPKACTKRYHFNSDPAFGIVINIDLSMMPGDQPNLIRHRLVCDVCYCPTGDLLLSFRWANDEALDDSGHEQEELLSCKCFAQTRSFACRIWLAIHKVKKNSSVGDKNNEGVIVYSQMH